KIHEVILDAIHRSHQHYIIYADLAGQSSGLIGSYAAQSKLVVILDHHLPGGKTPGHVLHLNPEHWGINGDTEVSGAAVSCLFARELMRLAGVDPGNTRGELALLAVLGAYGDGQLQERALIGVNAMLLAEAFEHGFVREVGENLVIPNLGEKSPKEVTEILNLLGSIGFYDHGAETAVRFLLGDDRQRVLEMAASLSSLKKSLFEGELLRIRQVGLRESPHFHWVDVKDRFMPMGVKAIGLFLEALIAEDLVGPDRYVVGFQHFPESVPGVGSIGLSLTKVSARVPPQLREKIEHGLLPDLMKLFPEATVVVDGTADGCHRFSAASLIEQGREEEFITALEQALSVKGQGSL
ncbi:MAG: hypothetical protein LJE89_17180, partial [Deltaproteobacteria bacterium]|nr:hypothetical protein [Deltaproteobacteria bacterium]